MQAQTERRGAGSAEPQAASLGPLVAGASTAALGQKCRWGKERAESVSPAHGPRDASALAAASAAERAARSLNSSGISRWQLISLEVACPTPLAPVRCRVQREGVTRIPRRGDATPREFGRFGGARR